VMKWQLGPGTIQEPRGKGISAVESRFQAITSEDNKRLRRYGVSSSGLKSVEQACQSVQ
jgi:hypothetical protein